MTRRETERKLAAELEAHDNVDIALSEELFKGGCPLCRHRVVQGRRFLRSLVYEGVNDVGFRKVLERSRGFCERHTVALYEADRDEMGGALGAAILLESVLRHRLAELASAGVELNRINRQRLDLAAAHLPAPPVLRRTTGSSTRSSGFCCVLTTTAGARHSRTQPSVSQTQFAWPRRQRSMRSDWPASSLSSSDSSRG